MQKIFPLVLAIFLYVIFTSSVLGQNKTPQEIQREIQGKILAAKPGDTVKLDAGRFPLIRSLFLSNRNNITIMGAGKEETILSFNTQEEGLEGFKIFNCQDIRLIGFGIENSWGDGLTIQNVDGIAIQKVRVAWPKSSNKNKNGHGIYSARSNRILIDSCETRNGLNAGIQVRQCRNLIIQGSNFAFNVTGINILNSSNVEVHHNQINNNSIGISIMNLPGLVVNGEQVKIFKNEIIENNIKNFAPETYFNHSFPDGTGIVIMAYRKVEVFENEIVNNKSIGTFVISFLTAKLDGGHPEDIEDSFIISQDRAAYDFERDTIYSPYCASINVYENTFYREEQKPITGNIFNNILASYFKKNIPSIVFDGVNDPAKQDKPILCLQNNRNATFVKINGQNKLRNPKMNMDSYNCNLPPLTPVSLYKD